MGTLNKSFPDPCPCFFGYSFFIFFILFTSLFVFDDASYEAESKGAGALWRK